MTAKKIKMVDLLHGAVLAEEALEKMVTMRSQGIHHEKCVDVAVREALSDVTSEVTADAFFACLTALATVLEDHLQRVKAESKSESSSTR